MYAIVETGGKQIKAQVGQSICIEKIPQEKGEKISLDKVLMLVSARDSKIGNPFIEGAKVNGHVIEHTKDKKIIVYKMRPKKGTRKKQGHRQWHSRVLIESIEQDGKILLKAEDKKKKLEARTKKQEEQPTEVVEKTHKKSLKKQQKRS